MEVTVRVTSKSNYQPLASCTVYWNAKSIVFISWKLSGLITGYLLDQTTRKANQVPIRTEFCWFSPRNK